MKNLRLSLILIAFTSSVATAGVESKPANGLIDRTSIISHLEKGVSVNAVISQFGKPFQYSKLDKRIRLDYVYWPIPKIIINVKKESPRGVILFFDNEKLTKWTEYYSSPDK